MTQTLGKLERVDLREVWQSEPQDFTPWLAGEDNLACQTRLTWSWRRGKRMSDRSAPISCAPTPMRRIETSWSAPTIHILAN